MVREKESSFVDLQVRLQTLTQQSCNNSSSISLASCENSTQQQQLARNVHKGIGRRREREGRKSTCRDLHGVVVNADVTMSSAISEKM